MKETGIIMSGNHPKLIQDGIKTMTRRTWGLDKVNENPSIWEITPTLNHSIWAFYTTDNVGAVKDLIRIKCPYGQVGDLLIIKETWATENKYNHLKPSEVPLTAKIWYLADEQYDSYVMGIIRPSMFMCRWMSRARPVITEVRVERLQEISLVDCIAEGTKYMPSAAPREQRLTVWEIVFAGYWDSLNAKRGYGWDKNPWCWVIKFDNIGVRMK